MSDAKATVESSIIGGLSKRAHKTGMRMGPVSEMLIEDLRDELFDSSVRWAVVEYAKELDAAKE
jgi:hypothetical protein